MTRPPRWLTAASTALAGAVSTVALLGPLGVGAIQYRVAPVLRDQLIGSDAVALALLAPLALLAAALLHRGSPHGPVLALGPALATWYLAAELVLGPDRTGARPGNDEAFLPLFLLVLLLAATVALGAWKAIAPRSVAFDRPTRTVIGGLLILVVGLHVLARYLPAWLDVVHGTAGADYHAGPAVWWVVAFEDLALLLPAAALAGIGLLRGADRAGRTAFAAAQALALVAAAVTGMAWSTTAHGDAGASVGTAVLMTVLGLLSASPAAVCWIAVVRTDRARRRLPPSLAGTLSVPYPRAATSPTHRIEETSC